MTKSLPSSPNLQHLRDEAKSLLKAHKKKDRSCCKILKHVRPFQSETDEGILGSPVSLQEVQFGLAMAYGFKSWTELKRHVEKSVKTSSLKPRKEGNRVFLPGLEDVQWGPGFYDRDNSLIRCIATVLESIGERISYEEIMGFSGMAFRLHFVQPPWCPTGTLPFFGYNALDRALDVLGYSIQKRNLHGDAATPDNIKDAKDIVITRIQEGCPLLYNSEECGIIVGYEDGGEKLIFRPYAGGEPGYAETSQYPWSVDWLKREKPRAAQHDSVTASLNIAVELHRTASYKNHPFNHIKEYANGAAAYAAWIAAIGESGDDAQGGILHTNAHTYGSLANARRAASVYLGMISQEIGQETASHLSKAAGLYQDVYNHLVDSRQCILPPWRKSWTKENRGILRDVLGQCLPLEDDAVSALEAAAKTLD